MSNNTHIVKVQVSQFTTERVPQILVYDFGQEIYWSGDAEPEILSKLKWDKSFWEAKITKAGKIELIKRVSDRSW